MKELTVKVSKRPDNSFTMVVNEALRHPSAVPKDKLGEFLNGSRHFSFRTKDGVDIGVANGDEFSFEDARNVVPPERDAVFAFRRCAGGMVLAECVEPGFRSDRPGQDNEPTLHRVGLGEYHIFPRRRVEERIADLGMAAGDQKEARLEQHKKPRFRLAHIARRQQRSQSDFTRVNAA